MSFFHPRSDLDRLAGGDALPRSRAGRVAAHLERCRTCRHELETLRRGREALRALGEPALPADAWSRVADALARERAREAPGLPLHGWTGTWRAASLAAAVLVAASGILVLVTLPRPMGGRPVETLAGTPHIGGRSLGEAGRLVRGAWLETDASSRARVSFGRLGHLDVEPGSRVRLLASSRREQRLDLQVGAVRAVVTAPPRLFIVDTPAARAVDLGCAYDLRVDPSGDARLDVFSGLVALVRDGREIVVPAAASCRVSRRSGPLAPTWRDAPPAWRAAAERLALGHLEDLSLVLAGARTRDVLTLLHLVPRVDGQARQALVRRSARLSPPPPGVTVEGVIGRDLRMLDRWIASR